MTEGCGFGSFGDGGTAGDGEAEATADGVAEGLAVAPAVADGVAEGVGTDAPAALADPVGPGAPRDTYPSGAPADGCDAGFGSRAIFPPKPRYKMAMKYHTMAVVPIAFNSRF